MSPERYAAPLSIVETRSDDQQRCPYCRWGTHSFYRLDSWSDDYAGCAFCVLELLADDDEYLIYYTRGSASTPSNPDEQTPRGEQSRSRPTPPTEAQPTSDPSKTHQSADG
jgi:hypothetical protein